MGVLPFATPRYDHLDRPLVSIPLLLQVVVAELRTVRVGSPEESPYRILPRLPDDYDVVRPVVLFEHVGMIR